MRDEFLNSIFSVPNFCVCKIEKQSFHIVSGKKVCDGVIVFDADEKKTILTFDNLRKVTFECNVVSSYWNYLVMLKYTLFIKVL